MEKYLFTDGTNWIREVQSKEELESIIRSSGDPAKARIWRFSTSEWITYDVFCKQTVATVLPVKKTVIKEEKKQVTVISSPKKPGNYAGGIKFFVTILTALAIFLVYNFTRVKWHTASSLQITASRPDNTPPVDVDSLIQAIEAVRGQKLDKVTQTNLRIRNTWPDRIVLRLKSDRDTGQSGTKFYNLELSIDNSTGYNVDNAIVELTGWNNNGIIQVDTIHFSDIGYSAVSNRVLPNEFKGDSLSLSFLSIRAKAFNFCYSYDKESNYGNFNDRWFCRE